MEKKFLCMTTKVFVYCDLCVAAKVFVYCDLCMAGNYILDRFMSAMYIMQSGLCIVFAHNGAVAAHYFPDNNVLCLHTHNVYCVL